MQLFLVFLVFLSVLLPKENKKISIQIYNYNKPEWWSKFNNNGLNFNQSNISFSYKNSFDDYELLFGLLGSVATTDSSGIL